MLEILDESSLCKALNDCTLIKQMFFFEEIDSTNNFIKNKAFDNTMNCTLVFAERQTKGRGRLGRFWDSPSGLGLWFSVLFVPVRNSLDQIQWMQMGVNACYLAIQSFCDIQLKIKWPNDLLYKNKKVGGILTELSYQGNHINRAIVGIGVNVNQYPEDFDPRIREKAISLRMIIGHEINRLNLLVQIVHEMEKVYLSDKVL